ncbi:MAG: exodeoxyribonuclease VII small subunit [Bacteroidaceae bacterium]|nr:exodeoxyribonuclease VII small subunit [Bacteroidaceae bacterium]
MKDTKLNYEKAIKRLEEITGQMERGEVSLDAVVGYVREAKELMQYCKECLYEAEKNCASLLSVDENN